MRFRALPLLAILTALYGPPAAADLRCGSFNQIDAWLRGPQFNEVEVDIWIISHLTFRHYRNFRTGTWTILYSWISRPGRVAACFIAIGTDTPERKS